MRATQDPMLSSVAHAEGVPIDAASDVTNDSADEASEAGGPSRAGYSTEVKEYMVTLPFSSSRRPLYDDIILQSRPDIEDFCQVFHNEVLRTPRPSSVHKIEKLFLSLLNICDLPPELDARSFKKLSPKEIQNLAQHPQPPQKVLIVARSEKILFLLENLVVAEHYAYSRTGLGDMKYDHAQWPINIVLSLPNQPLVERTSDFDLIIGFDYEFKRSNVASRLSDYTPSESRQPMVLQLVLTHSIEHLDLSITEKDPDMPSFDHKNAIVIGLTKLRRLILNPDVGREPPHETAARFANQLKYYSEDFTWEPIPIPDEIFNFYLESSQPAEIESLQSKKRKLDDTESLATKRRRISNKSASMVNAEQVEALAPIIRCLGPEALDREDLKHETLVPTSLLAAMEVKFNERSAALQELRALVKELRQMNEDLQMQNNSYAKSTAAVKKLSERLSATQEAKSKLAKELAELKATHASNEPSDGPAPAALAGAAPRLPRMQQLQSLRKRPRDPEAYEEGGERGAELDYTREAYQNASQSASDLGNENRDLTSRIADLEHKASENLRQIHQINLENQAARLARLNDEQAATLREREWELDRLRDEVRILKAARRETRQASVPRSPHMGVMSPRAAGRAVTAGAAAPGVGGPPSRGSSPAAATDASGVPLFGQQPGNGRWGHLRD
ncbi:unnamed protein product [Parascedosporium putredinis]|uniref:HDA1 complex subunit n=1 Tax=Parascedosporium putredinis TaxID=1442378 RepID=A0A9P1H1M4_9PEZI|nr:unnamed protein product [Parascedosporium putredinis]CAI7992900.1 unnamed protein product [Parascedosporium putredinis]